jgi:hypothetical protein
MLLVMRIGSAIRRRLGASIIPVALLAALPLVQWCALGVDDASRPCAAAAHPAAAACAGAMPGCAHGVQEGECPFAPASKRTVCVGQAMGGPGVRPLAPELPAPPPQVFAIVPVVPVVADPAGAFARNAARPEPRPPTHSAARRPPARAPPAS